MPVKILLVDDDDEFRTVTMIALESAGYLVCEAANALVALERMHLDRPDVVISDLSMPGLDGREFCRQVRANPNFDGVRLLILSALIEPEESSQSQIADADDCLSKLDCVTHLLNRIEALTTH